MCGIDDDDDENDIYILSFFLLLPFVYVVVRVFFASSLIALMFIFVLSFAPLLWFIQNLSCIVLSSSLLLLLLFFHSFSFHMYVRRVSECDVACVHSDFVCMTGRECFFLLIFIKSKNRFLVPSESLLNIHIHIV